MNTTRKTPTVALLAALGLVAAAALAGPGPAWAFDDYYVRQWEIADKEVIKLDKDITDLNEDILEMNAKLGEHPTKQESEDIRRQAARSQARIDLKEDRIEFLESEIERLEKLSIESFKIDPDTEASLAKAVDAIESAYGQGHNFTAMIDRQDREVLVTVPPNSTLTAGELEAAVNYSATVRVETESMTLAACTRPSSACRPLEGGVSIGVDTDGDGDGDYDGTLGYRATRTDGTVGYVTAAHTVERTGMRVKQPAGGLAIGTVQAMCYRGVPLANGDLDGRDCDSAFIRLDPRQQATSRIIKNNGGYYTITSVANAAPEPGTFLKKSGAVTGVTYASLNAVGSKGDLNRIVFSNSDDRATGDSGSPVFRQLNSRSNGVELHGMMTTIGVLKSGDTITAFVGYHHPQDHIARQLSLR